MSISAVPGNGIPGGKKGHPRRGTAPAEAPPPGVRENTCATVTACVENYGRRAALYGRERPRHFPLSLPTRGALCGSALFCLRARLISQSIKF